LDKYYDEKYNLGDESNLEADLKKNINLKQPQINELNLIVKKYLGKNLTEHEAAKMFDSDFETFMLSFNELVKQSNSEVLKQDS